MLTSSARRPRGQGLRLTLLGVGASSPRPAAGADPLPRRRLVFAHIGRPTLRAIDGGHQPPWGEWGSEGRTYTPAHVRIPPEDGRA